MTQMARRLFLLLAAASFDVPAIAQDPGVTAVRLDIEASVLSGGEGAKGKVGIVRNTAVPPQPVVVRFSTSNSSLVRFVQAQITIPVGEDTGAFEYGTAATPIATSVNITASAEAPDRPQATRALQLVPALLRRVSLSSTSMIGTRGRTIDCTAELKAPAPQGGIELYPGGFFLNPSVTGVKAATVPIVNPRVAAGSRTVTFPIRYEDVVATFSALQRQDRDFSAVFESQTRRVERLVSIDPSLKTPVSGQAVKVGFDLVPLRVSSIVVQPSTLSGVGEALATVTLSAAPGNEVAGLGSTGHGTFVVLAGSSCGTAQGALSPQPELQIPAGVTTHIFKVCGKQVTAPASDVISVTMRSGSYTTNVTRQP